MAYCQVSAAAALAAEFEAEAAAVRNRIASEQRTHELVAVLRRAEGAAAVDLQVHVPYDTDAGACDPSMYIKHVDNRSVIGRECSGGRHLDFEMQTSRLTPAHSCVYECTYAQVRWHS